MEIQQNVNLNKYCTFRIGGLAKYFVVIKSLDDLKQVVDFAKEKKLKIYILGGGSNLLIADEGVAGLVLKMENKGIDFKNISDDIIQVIAEAGEIWDDFVQKTIDKKLYGLENLSYIPGTVGASAVQNIGAYGVEAKDFIEWVEVFDLETGEVKKITKEECCFEYRGSLLKKEKQLVVLRVAYNLKKSGNLNLNYKDVQNYISQNNLKEISIQDLRDIIIEIRKNKLPDWHKIGTAGSFFKNPVVTKQHLENLQKEFGEIQNYPDGENFKIPLAFVLDKILNLKGYRDGEVGLFETQPLALVNYGNATMEDIRRVVKMIKDKTKEKTGLEIEEEVVYW